MMFKIYISGSSSNQQALLPYQPTQPQKMNAFLCHAVPWAIPLLSGAPMHSAKKFQSCSSKNSSGNKSIGVSSFYVFIVELDFLLVLFFLSFQLS
jgi:hypothetical protein